MLKLWKIQGQFLSVVSSPGWTSDLTGSHRHSSVSEAGPLGRASGQHAVLRACERREAEPSPATRMSWGCSQDSCRPRVSRDVCA